MTAYQDWGSITAPPVLGTLSIMIHCLSTSRVKYVCFLLFNCDCIVSAPQLQGNSVINITPLIQQLCGLPPPHANLGQYFYHCNRCTNDV